MTSDQRGCYSNRGVVLVLEGQPLSLLEEKKGPRLWWLARRKGRGGNSVTSQRHWK